MARRQSWARTLAAAAAGALALVTGVLGPGPARADAADAPQKMTVQFAEHELGIGITTPPSADLSYRWKLAGSGTVHHVHLTVDLSGVAGFAEPDPAEHCKDNLCTLDLASVSKSDYHAFRLTAKPGAPAGASGTVTVSGTASDATVTGDHLTLTNGRPEVNVTESADREHQKVGDLLAFPINVWNVGQLPAAKGVQLRIDTTAGMLLQDSWANCRDTAAPKDGPSRAVYERLCDFPAPVDAGMTYALSSPLHVKVGEKAMEDYLAVTIRPLTGPPAANGPGKALTLVPKGTEPPNDTEGYAFTYIHTDNHADFGVTGDTVTGRRGGHATLHVELAAHGPAVVEDVYDFDEFQFAKIKLPPGTTATKIPENCYPVSADGDELPGPKLGRSSYECSFGDLVPGNKWPLAFTIAIGPHTPAVSTGRISTEDDWRGLHPVPSSNDTAALTLKLTQGGSGSGGTSGGSGSAGASGATGSSGTSGTSGSASAGTSTGSGPLADTGFDGGWIPWAAGALVLAGGVAVALTRRSRTERG